MEWNYKQKLVLENEEQKGKQNLLVSAAAGSGKTAVLVERIRRLVMEQNVSIDNMLVVTFTDAASSDMKAKIFKSLNEQLGKETNKEKREILFSQISKLNRANISTFASFALEVVHSYYQIIGIDPGLRICDEDKALLLKEEALSEVFSDLFESSDADFLSLCDLYGTSLNCAELKSMVLDIHRFMETQVNPQVWQQRVLDGSQLNAIYKFACNECAFRLGKALKSTKELQKFLLTEKLPNTAAKLNEDVANLEELITCFESENVSVSDLGFEKLALFNFARFGNGTGEKEIYGKLKETIDVAAIRDNFKKPVADKKYSASLKAVYSGLSYKLLQDELANSKEILRKLFALTSKFGACFSEKKTQLGFLDFADAERYAMQILQNENVAAEYKEKFKYIFVDEYQDSNNIQESLINLIARGDNVFMVGDVKQSIYKFRKAEPSLFLDKYYKFSSGIVEKSEAIDLNCNFRSKSSVLNFINYIFSLSMSQDSCGIDYNERVALVRGFGEDTDKTINYIPQLHIVKIKEEGENFLAEGEDEEIEELKASEIEARLAAKLIKDWLGKTISENGKEGEIQRSLKYKDMVILLRSVKTDGEVYYNELSKQNIPCYLQRSQGYFDTVEIRMFLALLKLIDNKEKDIPLLAVLRNPVFGFSADDLAEIRAYSNANIDPDPYVARYVSYRKAFNFYAKQGENKELSAKCRNFIQNIDRWRLESGIMPAGEFIARLLDQTGIANFYGSSLNGEQQLANLQALSDKAEKYQESYIGGLGGFIKFVENIADSKKSVKTDAGQAATISESADCVRIITVHASKGLEYPLVIYAGLGKKMRSKNAGSGPISLHKDFGAWVDLKRPKTQLVYKCIGRRITNYKARKEEDAETLRLMYVATTRAKDVLLLTGTVTNNKTIDEFKYKDPEDIGSASTYLDIIAPCLYKSGGEYKPVIYSAESFKGKEAEKKNIDVFSEISAAAAKLTEQQRLAVQQAVNFDLNYAVNKNGKRKYSVSEITSLTNGEYKQPRRYIEREDKEYIEDLTTDSLEPMEIGTAYHTVLEHLPFCAAEKTSEQIEEFVNRLAEKRILTQAQAKAVNPEIISAFFNSDIAKRAMASSEIRKEVPFVLKHKFEGREVLVQGVIDLCFKENGKWILVDYKTNRINPENKAADIARLTKHYEPQLSLYKEALEAITGIPVESAQLYFLLA